MTIKGYVEGLKYLIGETIQYYCVCKQKSYNGTILRINMGCNIYPREKNFWDYEAAKTITSIDKYIYEMAVYDGIEARAMEAEVKKRLEDIDYQCDAYRWNEERLSKMKRNEEKESGISDINQAEEPEWNVEEYAVGIEYLSFLRQHERLKVKKQGYTS